MATPSTTAHTRSVGSSYTSYIMSSRPLTRSSDCLYEPNEPSSASVPLHMMYLCDSDGLRPPTASSSSFELHSFVSPSCRFSEARRSRGPRAVRARCIHPGGCIIQTRLATHNAHALLPGSTSTPPLCSNFTRMGHPRPEFENVPRFLLHVLRVPS